MGGDDRVALCDVVLDHSGEIIRDEHVSHWRVASLGGRPSLGPSEGIGFGGWVRAGQSYALPFKIQEPLSSEVALKSAHRREPDFEGHCEVTRDV